MHLRRALTMIVATIVVTTAVAVGGDLPMAGAIPSGQSPEPRVIEVVVRRYAFEPAQIEVVTGEAVRIKVKSGDGLHGFSIAKLKIKKEIPRGETVTIDFKADAPGEFPILCSEFCGEGHEEMKGLLVVKARGADGK